jgi:hypothetical protein
MERVMRLMKRLQVLAVLGLCMAPQVMAAREAMVVAQKQSASVAAYMRYRKDVPKAKKLEDLYLDFDSKSVEFYKAMSAAERAKVLQQLKTQVEMFPNLTVVKEEPSVDTTNVTFTAKSADNKEATVIVEIIRQGAELRVGQATWK